MTSKWQYRGLTLAIILGTLMFSGTIYYAIHARRDATEENCHAIQRLRKDLLDLLALSAAASAKNTFYDPKIAKEFYRRANLLIAKPACDQV